MTNKVKKFCIEYLKDLNATQAAIRAGYSENTAYSIGWENLRKPEIKSFIDKQLSEVMEESKEVLKYRIIKELKAVSFTGLGIELIEKDDIIVDARVTDKLKAIDLLGKYLAMWTEKIELSGNADKPILVSIAEIMGEKDVG